MVAKQKAWMSFWDAALEHGVDGSRTALATLKLLCMSVFNERACPVKDCTYVVPDHTPACHHFITDHSNLPPECNPDFFVESITSIREDSELFLRLMHLCASNLYFSF